MKIVFSGNDNGIFSFGRAILKGNQNADLEFYLNSGNSQEFLSESNFWKGGVKEILKNHTRFGKIGFVYDRKNILAKEFIEKLNVSEFEYTSQEKSHRSEKNPEIFALETQIIHEMANEGLSDTVEFRRLSRKHLRPAKHSNIDTLFFLENIFAETKTRKIIDHITGSQIKTFFPEDFLDEKYFEETVKKREIKVHFKDESQDFLQTRAEQLLRTKLSKEDFTKE